MGKQILQLIELLDANASLNKEDRRMLEFIKTQMEDDWKTPLLYELKLIYQKYFAYDY